jgi:hypothetical protein
MIQALISAEDFKAILHLYRFARFWRESGLAHYSAAFERPFSHPSMRRMASRIFSVELA